MDTDNSDARPSRDRAERAEAVIMYDADEFTILCDERNPAAWLSVDAEDSVLLVDHR
ncbi:DUF7331 family protein [Halopiger goleimassiliensis]|uniref:DUF7331 family protein n=1 Tax=Halopiger goleimassiliensis TaxID=1293048 RepID=UPI000A64585E|nr:hypothetical protein [Halopiger goleimassiliensis]